MGEKYTDYEVDGVQAKGRPKRTWREVVEIDCQTQQLNNKDHSEWTLANNHKDTEQVDEFVVVPAHLSCFASWAIKQLLLLMSLGWSWL